MNSNTELLKSVHSAVQTIIESLEIEEQREANDAKITEHQLYRIFRAAYFQGARAMADRIPETLDTDIDISEESGPISVQVYYTHQLRMADFLDTDIELEPTTEEMMNTIKRIKTTG
jgi:hypothetical protein